MESDSSSQSSMESITSSEAVKQQSSTSSRRFSVAQTATLNSYYRAGMKGESKGAMPLIQSCSRETGLTTVQVKVSVALHVASLLKDPV